MKYQTTEDFDTFLRKSVKANYLLWILLTIADLIWFLVAFLEVNIGKAGVGFLSGKHNIIYFSCGILSVLSLILHRYLSSKKVIVNRIHKKRSPEAIVKRISNIEFKNRRLLMLQSLSDDELIIYEVISYLPCPIVICLGINNMISFSGYLLVLSVGKLAIMIPIVAISIILCLFMFPSPNRHIDFTKDYLLGRTNR
jgi:hypothetical protein